jgi:hypothetical protein
MARGFCTNHVTVVEPTRWLSWQASDERGDPVWTFTFGLFPVDANHTRLIVRESFRTEVVPPVAVAILEIPDVVMEQKALHTVKDRAEGIVQSALVTPLEITAWLAALVISLVAFAMFVRRGGWNFLEWSAMSVVIVLMLTFLFPPLWLRAVFDLGLLIGLLSMLREPFSFTKTQPVLKVQ